MSDERDLRLALLNTLLTTPHRELGACYPLHQEMITQDPRFYARLAAWYADAGDVRDHREMFVISLCLSSFEGHRVVDFIKGTQVKRRVPKAGTAPAAATHKRGKRRARGEMEIVVEQVGLRVNVPRSMRTEIARYL